MTKQVDLNAYNDFVKKVTSGESLSSMQMYNRMIDIETTESGMKVNAASLMTVSKPFVLIKNSKL